MQDGSEESQKSPDSTMEYSNARPTLIIQISLHFIFSPHSSSTFLYARRRFLVAFSNSTLAFVKEGAESTARTEYVAWPHQPFKLLSLGKRGTAVVCSDSTVWHIAFEDDRIPIPCM